ncbi:MULTISPECIES: TIGR03757 family integrating conjugative element protein [Pectobacteriaceae]|uniref:TIGR03757 family integrating conjugative element protein n=3 Tax=Pectobacteriaceae TaxID=1903410 RepID=A0A5J5FQD5_9GAMM|nr:MULTISPECIES: TIGR03757 family integrating conjugative element protein [Pectobacteriaceae]MEE3645293.1 TIGR03757 family integrating conjugative element protein [Brenneria sp. L3_3C_1]MEE3652972.1 TIGR03757 family integrating conjugative element protein [Brenneria sp. HEZEL_4_2_4]KAA8994693.1 TIGR03757 family integrating conjugative element protein [Affinibrenneria salicis]MBJ7224047.1 TIGR03757 family integrating conjugative element protein [Brenneria sp. L3-3C-1]MDX5628673.1 TIGR03757 fami
MPFRCFLTLLITLATQSTAAQAIIYTTGKWPVISPQPDTVVQILEDVQNREQTLFPNLYTSPEQAERQALLRMQQPDWQEKEARLTRAYQALMDAWSLGISKVPAVVFEDKYVVYGTTDIGLARQKLEAWRERQP